MGILDNSGDIILDAVLTDAGRERIAKGDFRPVKYTFGDDEINYGDYDKNHASGSAFFDLNILSTPLLEATTDNSSALVSKLVSYPRNNLLYLPVIKLNELPTENKRHSSSVFVVAVDETTEDDLLSVSDKSGIMRGARPGGASNGQGGGAVIRLDQGLDTTEISPSFTLDGDLVETQFQIAIDNRLGNIVDSSGKKARVSFIDDDNIAYYYLSLGTDAAFISENEEKDVSAGTEAISGPRGTILQFKILSSINLNTSSALFTELGSTATVNTFTVNYIDANVRVQGATTGAVVDIPVRFAKR